MHILELNFEALVVTLVGNILVYAYFKKNKVGKISAMYLISTFTVALLLEIMSGLASKFRLQISLFLWILAWILTLFPIGIIFLYTFHLKQMLQSARHISLPRNSIQSFALNQENQLVLGLTCTGLFFMTLCVILLCLNIQWFSKVWLNGL